jgi:hypothetical protein
MRNLNLVIFLMAMIVAGFMFTGCGGNETMMSEISGIWKSDKDGTSIAINLSGKQKNVEIGGNAFPVTVKKVDEGSYIVVVDAKLANGKTSEWSFIQA